ncbi:MAG: hypothetical protein WDZ37_01640 [Solirubrobacterales bacterium]
MSHLSYANVMATIALFIALGGTSYAVRQINGKMIKNRTISANKIERNSLSGAEINEARLGRVSSAARADSADTADTADTAASATSAGNADTLDGLDSEGLRVGCPGGTITYAGVCFETGSRVGQSYPSAAKTCGDLGGRLPSVGELQGFRQLDGVTLSGEMSLDMFSDTAQFAGEIGYFRVDDGGSVNTIAGSTSTAYRCVFERTN